MHHMPGTCRVRHWPHVTPPCLRHLSSHATPLPTPLLLTTLHKQPVQPYSKPCKAITRGGTIVCLSVTAVTNPALPNSKTLCWVLSQRVGGLPAHCQHLTTAAFPLPLASQARVVSQVQHHGSLCEATMRLLVLQLLVRVLQLARCACVVLSEPTLRAQRPSAQASISWVYCVLSLSGCTLGLLRRDRGLSSP